MIRNPIDEGQAPTALGLVRLERSVRCEASALVRDCHPNDVGPSQQPHKCTAQKPYANATAGPDRRGWAFSIAKWQ
jgi:hypothetical protein